MSLSEVWESAKPRKAAKRHLKFIEHVAAPAGSFDLKVDLRRSHFATEPMTLLPSVGSPDDEPAAAAEPPHIFKKPTFSDARLGALQLKTQGLRAFGGFAESARPDTAAQAAAKDPAPLPPPPPAVLPRPGSSHAEAALSARLLRGVGSHQQQQPWDSWLQPSPPQTPLLSPRARGGVGGGGAGSGPLSDPISTRSPRRPIPPMGYARPPTRGDALGLSDKLRTTIERGGRHTELDTAWHTTFLELVRQVYVHCAERGQLLDAVRVHLEQELKSARTLCAQQARELAKLRRDASVLLGGSSSGAGAGAGAVSAVDARVAEEQRMTMLTDAAGRLAPASRAALLARVVTGSEEAGSREALFGATLDALPEAERLKVLGTALEAQSVGNLMRVLGKVLEKVEKSHRLLLLGLLTNSLDDAAKAKHALEVTQHLTSEARAAVAKSLFHNLPKLTRRPAVAELLSGLSKGERIELTSDVLSSIPLSDLVELTTKRCDTMDGSTRIGFVTETMGTISLRERNQLVEELLVKMPGSDREKLLGNLFGMLSKSEREELQTLLQRTMRAGDKE